MRKRKLVKLKGGMCQKCGYRRNLAALEFHHRERPLKTFNLDLRSLSNRKWAQLLRELEKCDLLCSNCHKELHNPASMQT